MLRSAFNIYSKVGRHSDALRMALKAGSRELAEEAFGACPGAFHKKQLAYILGRHGLGVNLEEGPAAVADDDLREQLQQIMRWGGRPGWAVLGWVQGWRVGGWARVHGGGAWQHHHCTLTGQPARRNPPLLPRCPTTQTLPMRAPLPAAATRG